jgi:CheY-like chemotaxis protein
MPRVCANTFGRATSGFPRGPVARHGACGWRAHPSRRPTLTHPVILVADDDRTIRDVIAAALTDEIGARVLRVDDGEGLLALVRQVRPAAIVTDVKMPRVGGLEVALALAADPRTAGIPIVAVSAVTDRQACLDAGCRAFLAKPFELDELVGVVRSCLVGAAGPPGA